MAGVVCSEPRGVAHALTLISQLMGVLPGAEAVTRLHAYLPRATHVKCAPRQFTYGGGGGQEFDPFKPFGVSLAIL
jgi:hypothetical protein